MNNLSPGAALIPPLVRRPMGQPFVRGPMSNITQSTAPRQAPFIEPCIVLARPIKPRLLAKDGMILAAGTRMDVVALVDP